MAGGREKNTEALSARSRCWPRAPAHCPWRDDLAYDYGTAHIEFDNAEGQHVALDSAALRVWRKVDGQWKVAIAFAHPYHRE